MTKCTYNEFSEEILDTITHIVENGEEKATIFDDGSGEPTGFFNIHCCQCDRYWRFNRFVSTSGLHRVPRWIRDIAEMLDVPFIVVRR